MELTADTEVKAKFEAQIKEFMASDQEKLEFPSSLTIDERRMVHDIAYDNNLLKQSRGPKSGGRFITVSKPNSQQRQAMEEQKTKRQKALTAELGPEKQREQNVTSTNFTYPDTSTMERASSCWLPQDFIDLPLVNVLPCNHDSKIFEFGLPAGTSLNLPVCACLLVKCNAADGESVCRPYTPISDNSMTGKFQLLIKRYAEGNLSRCIHELAIGSVASFKHIPFNIKVQLPFAAESGIKSISALVGGTGITPIYQAMQSLANTVGDMTELTVLYGSKTESDILLKPDLDEMVAKSMGRFKILYILSAAQAEWDGLRGHIDAEKIKVYCAPPSQATKVFVCGVPAMYDDLCGPRNEKDVASNSALAKLGYSSDMVVKF